MTLSDHKGKQLIRDTVQKCLLQYKFSNNIYSQCFEGLKFCRPEFWAIICCHSNICAIYASFTHSCAMLHHSLVSLNNAEEWGKSAYRFTSLIDPTKSQSRACTRFYFCKCSFIQVFTYRDLHCWEWQHSSISVLFSLYVTRSWTQKHVLQSASCGTALYWPADNSEMTLNPWHSTV
jgi:hypothetical protein